MRYLRLAEYELVLLEALRRLDIPEAYAKAIIGARWPMPAATLVVEATGRGLTVTLDDVLEWLAETLGETAAAEVFAMGPPAVEDCLAWCVATGRAKSNDVGERLQTDFRVVEEKFLRPSHAGEN